MKTIKKIAKVLPLLVCAYAGSAQALTIKFNHAADMDARALAGFQAAADNWSRVLHDNVTVNLNIGFSALGPGVLGSTGSTRGTVSYDAFRDARQPMPGARPTGLRLPACRAAAAWAST
ncbi:hypothetical protein G4G28_21815 [Massilia sp. Dwa41.01b]|uniref:hypothetical protein n=1 Tax=Massilia sp. Dwa41.01b TaxID=2709302 RepID=UPI0015FF3021|nr:hypothetical protein [Massilia sp. Dwa41.01b]QNA90477.1 hypothetical protein G4G28_21815 [Massilia sp. Dwa41.01b]